VKSQSILVLTLCCPYFILAGLLLIPYAGFQHDEVVFAQPFFQHGVTFYSCRLGSLSIPMMINSYAGSFKTWLYWPVLELWNPSAFSIRVPAMLIAALSILLFWPIMVRAGGKRAAAIATVLLATDSMYLMTSVFDWGPCALQHFFLVAVMLTFIRFDETGKIALLALGSFLAGVALWEKALFFWFAGALAVAALAIYPKCIWRRVSMRNLIVATAGFAIGATPLILYNIHKPNSTLGENVLFSTGEFDEKLELAKRTINAYALSDYIVYSDWMPLPHAPRNAMESASLALRDATGSGQKSAMLWAYGLSILLVPLVWRTRVWRPMLFALIFTAVGWVQMLFTKNAGGSVHHIILLWPMPVMFLSLAFSEASRRLPRKVAIPALYATVGFFTAENILAANQYLAEFIRNGPTRDWTNAIYPLSADVLQSHYGTIAGIDWGTVVPLGILQRGTVPMDEVSVDDNDPQPALEKMGKDGFVFLTHVKGQEYFTGVDDKMDGIAARNGFARHSIKTFADENGRPVFELFQYRRSISRTSWKRAE
jgi:hypothetical protein